MSLKSVLTAIGDKFRQLGSNPDKKFTLAEMPEKIEEVYAEGLAGGYDRGYDEGRRGEYNIFWDAYQQNGTTTDYANMFSGRGWTNDTFKPKYDITVQNAYMLFRYCGIVDLGEALRQSGKRLILDANQLSYTFNNTLMEVIDGIEFTKPIERFDATFSHSGKLREIKVPLPITETSNLSGFDGCSYLEEVWFNGVIGTSTLNLKACTKLSLYCIRDLIQNLSSSTSGLSVTLSRTAVNTAFGSTDSEEWLALINARSNWTINLV